MPHPHRARRFRRAAHAGDCADAEPVTATGSELADTDDRRAPGGRSTSLIP